MLSLAVRRRVLLQARVHNSTFTRLQESVLALQGPATQAVTLTRETANTFYQSYLAPLPSTQEWPAVQQEFQQWYDQLRQLDYRTVTWHQVFSAGGIAVEAVALYGLGKLVGVIGSVPIWLFL